MSLSTAAWLPVVVALVLALGTVAAAPQAADSQRYRMQKVEGGVVRLDTLTGEMVLCLAKQDRLVCDPAENRLKALRHASMRWKAGSPGSRQANRDRAPGTLRSRPTGNSTRR